MFHVPTSNNKLLKRSQFSYNYKDSEVNTFSKIHKVCLPCNIFFEVANVG